MSGPYDIFICHDHAASAAVKRLTAALAGRGLACFAYEAGGDPDIQPKLATSRCFLGWASESFFLSRGCQAHLAMVHVACRQAPATDSGRLLLVNPEPGIKHVYPLSLRRTIIGASPETGHPVDFAGLAERLQGHCERLSGGTLGALYPAPRQNWLEPYDSLSRPPGLFVGRERELWDVHTALHGHGGSPGPCRCAVVSGDAGVGKSLLSREYAFRFGAAYPGGVYRLSAMAARPAARLAELAENPALKPQLLALLRHLRPDTGLRDDSRFGDILAELRQTLEQAGKPYLWIVDDLPDDLNGPVLQQWLARGEFGHSLLICRSQRYDARFDPVHLPMPSERTALHILTRDRPPRGDELDAAGWLVEELGRHPRYAAMIGALAEGHRHRRTAYSWLLHRLEKRTRAAINAPQPRPSAPPAPQEARGATILLESLRVLGGPARDILRLGAELAPHPLPLDFIVECLLAGGLAADDRREDIFTILLHEPQEIPLTREAAIAYVAQGATSLEQHGLAQRTDHGVTLFPLAVQTLQRIAATSPRQILLRDAALQVLYLRAEHCRSEDDWRPLSAMAVHGRALIADLRERLIEEDDSPGEITGRIRLALYLADLALAHGARRQALEIYRAASAYLVRAMAADTHNGTRQRDFARVQEQLGDLLAEQQQWADALEHYRKSLGIRVFMARQEAPGLDHQHDPLRLHTKARDVQLQLGDLEGALHSQRAAHVLHCKLAEQCPADDDHAFQLASSHLELAEMHLGLQQNEAALAELQRALPCFEALAERHRDQVRFVRAPAMVHNRIGDILRARDDLSGALNCYRTALAIAALAAQLEPGDAELRRDLAICHNHLGDTLAGLDDAAEAEQHFLAFLEIAEHPDNQPAFADLRRRDIAAVLIKLGRGRELAKELEPALERYQRARGILETLAIEHPDNPRLREDLGWLRRRIERLVERRHAELRRQARVAH